MAFFEALISFHPEHHNLISDGALAFEVAGEDGQPTLLVNGALVSVR